MNAIEAWALDGRAMLGLANGSPGKGMGDDRRGVGSSIDMQAYLNGDFDGDGRRDLPPVPAAAAGSIGAPNQALRKE